MWGTNEKNKLVFWLKTEVAVYYADSKGSLFVVAGDVVCSVVFVIFCA